ncbi:MAG: septum formation family protein [Acidimicrobiia bacterium]|nr:septum formation family protein [Acidimicrobiia bacterium]
MRKLLAGVLVAVTLGGTACAIANEPERDEQGQVKEQGDVSIFHLRLGDCTQDASLGLVSNVGAVPCDQEHAYEVFAVAQYQGDTYDAAKIDSFAQEVCAAEFKTFVGRDVSDSVLDVTYLTPTADSFGRDDREVACLVGSGAAPTTGSLRGADR